MPSEFAGGNQASEIKLEHYFFLKLAVLGFILQVLDFISRNVFHFPAKYQCCSFTPQDIVYSLHTLYCNKSNYDIIFSLLEALLIIFKIPHTECLV